ncbi:MAG: hypothetical protein PHT69_04220 [Bacteroidales bacterium]|nr:hypothetical protein [Bacteroidales bacterium]
MTNHILNFILGTAGTIGTASAIDSIDPTQYSTIEDLIKYLISIVGGILATIIINLLKKKFPEWFETKNKK